MSGGSMNYICFRVEEASRMCSDAELSELLHDAADVLHDEEWWMSSDCSEEEYRESLAKFKEKWFDGDHGDRLKGYIDREIERCRERCHRIIDGYSIGDA